MKTEKSEGMFTLVQKLSIKWYDDSNAKRLEDILGYKFKKIELLHQAIQGKGFDMRGFDGKDRDIYLEGYENLVELG